jgi:hypothetical protein
VVAASCEGPHTLPVALGALERQSYRRYEDQRSAFVGFQKDADAGLVFGEQAHDGAGRPRIERAMASRPGR